MFNDMALRTTEKLGTAWRDLLGHLGGRPLRIGTICSGTECPIIALELFEEMFEALGKECFHHEHCFSAEIESFKHRHIARNWPNVPIFRDVRYFVPADDDKLHAAGLKPS